MSQADVATKIKVDTTIAPPPMFCIIYLNDNQTTVEFVIETLLTYFAYDITAAEQIAVEIHESGQAAVASYPYEIAEQKGIEVTMHARANGFPLQLKLIPEA